MIKNLFNRFINPYKWKIVLAIGLAAVAYIGFLKWDNHSLETKNTNLVKANLQLASDIVKKQETIVALEQRQAKSKQIEVNYDKVLKELKGKTNGPVSDVIRHAVHADVVR